MFHRGLTVSFTDLSQSTHLERSPKAYTAGYSPRVLQRGIWVCVRFSTLVSTVFLLACVGDDYSVRPLQRGIWVFCYSGVLWSIECI